MGINKRTAMTVFYVLTDEGLDEGRFTDAGFANEIHVRETVAVLDEDTAKGATGIGTRKECDVGIAERHAMSVSEVRMGE